MLNIILVLFFLFIYVWVLKKKRNGWLYPSVFLLSIYLLSISCLIISIFRGSSLEILDDRYLLPTVFFIVLVLLYFSTFTSFREDRIYKIVLPSKRTLDILSTILIVLSLESIIFFSSGVREVFEYGDLGAARRDRYIHDITFIESGIWYTISSVSASLYMFDIMFFFIYLIIDDKSKWRIALLLLGSFSEIFHVLTDVGRDGIVFWIFAFVFIYFIFRPFIRTSLRKKVNKLFVIISILISIPFMMISVSRFDDGLNESFISYMGQPFKHFCYFFDISPLPTNYGQSFPLYFEILNRPQPMRIEYGTHITHSSAFGTFFRGFLVNFGIVGTLVVGVFMSLAFILFMKRKRGVMYFNQFFIYILYFQIFSQGVFYFRQYTRGGNLFIILCFISALLFQIKVGYGQPVVLYRYKDN